MLELRTLGGLDLRHPDDGLGRAIPLQTKRLVLLAYLAGAPGKGYRRRDSLLCLFWPELDHEHARGALRQALHALRKALGDGVILTQGEAEVGLDHHLIRSDIQALEGRRSAGQAAEALALYRGDFLEGVFATDASSELEEWIARERGRLRRVAAEVAWQAAEDPNDAKGPGDFIRRAVELSGADEGALRRGVQMMDRLGDRAGAAALYEQFAHRIAREFDVELSAESQAAIRALRARSAPVAVPPSTARPAIAPSRPDDSLEEPPPGPVPPRSKGRWYVAGAASALAMLGIAAAIGLGHTPAPGTVITDGVAVLPFQVTPADTTFAWLRVGLPELLAPRLAGAGGIHVLEPGRVLSALRQEGTQAGSEPTEESLGAVAKKLGAAWFVEGIVVSTPQLIVLQASLRSIPRGESLARAEVRGPPDSLSALVDQLAARLLGASLGVEEERLGSIASPSFAAIRAFVAGRAAFRRGKFDEAAQEYREAVTLDSAFALAGLELARSSERAGGRLDWALGIRTAMAGRDRLSPADRSLLDAMAVEFGDAQQMFGKRNSAIRTTPYWPESWYALGNAYLYYGMLSGQADAFERAELAYLQGWQLDSAADLSSFGGGALVAAPTGHLVELAHMRGDTAEVRRLATRVVAIDSTSDLARAVRWHLAVIEGDAARRTFWETSGPLNQRATMEIVLFITWTGIGAADYPTAAAADIRHLRTHDPGYTWYALHAYAANQGRPHDAPVEFPASALEARGALRDRVRAALWWEGDSVAAADAVRALMAPLAVSADSRELVQAEYLDLCTVALWEAVRGHYTTVPAAATRLRAAHAPGTAESDSLWFGQLLGVCAALLDATRATGMGLSSAAALTATADSLARLHVSQVCCGGLAETNLLLARLWEAQGNLPRALQALRRSGGQFLRGPNFLSSFLREEGRIAALTGDTTGAERAYRQYLMLRYNPEPSMQPAVDQVRHALAALEGKPLP